ncbi:MAG: hypothetical protein OXN97_18035 [Bryobacterales bacterium]|nr:hypothetical protein [Bryobacterales bacterium]MDE0624969.1 hypothetical protein [Bryobacterales bacterium]
MSTSVKWIPDLAREVFQHHLPFFSSPQSAFGAALLVPNLAGHCHLDAAGGDRRARSALYR